MKYNYCFRVTATRGNIPEWGCLPLTRSLRPRAVELSVDELLNLILYSEVNLLLILGAISELLQSG